MTQRLGIRAITPETTDWTCKIQIVDKCGPRISKDKKLTYLNMIFQDEQEVQVKASIYGEKIPKFLEKYKFELYHSYLITGARVKPSNIKFERALHEYEWVIDVKTIIDPIKEKDPVENVLSLPTMLTLTSFGDIKTIDNKNTEIDILGIVVNCFPPRYVSMKRKLQELIVIDPLKEAFTFTIWEEDIIENEEAKLLRDFKQYPTILARRIRVSDFNGKSFETRFNTTIQINPPYPQYQLLHKWVMENNEMLASFTTRSTSRSRSRSGPLISVPVEEKIISLANAQSQQDGHTFLIEAKISIPTYHQNFYILLCTNCGQEMRIHEIREVDCMTCNKKTLLTPRCRFEINLQDASGSAIGIVMGTDGEKILSLTTAMVYEIVSIKKESLPMQDIQSRLTHKLFKIQAKKLLSRTPAASGKLYILSCAETSNALNPSPEPSLNDISEASKRKKECLQSSDEDIEIPAEQSQSLKMKKKTETTTPLKTR